jgi:hypothetical protein
MTRYGNISIGDTVDEYLPTANGLVYYRTFVVKHIYRERDMNGKIVTMIGDHNESVISHLVKKQENER